MRYLVSLGAGVVSGAVDSRCVVNALESGHLKLVRYMVSIGADICVGSVESILAAVCTGNLEFVRYTISLGASFGGVSGGYLFVDAAEREDLKLLQYLTSRADIRAIVSESEYSTIQQFAARVRAAPDPRPRATRRVYFGWVPRCYDLARRSGRRARARNFREFRRLSSRAN